MKKFIPFEGGALETVETVMVRDPLILSPLMRAREALARLRQVGCPRISWPTAMWRTRAGGCWGRSPCGSW